MRGRTPPGDFLFVFILFLFGLFLDYLCAIFFVGWLETRNLVTMSVLLLYGSISVFLIYLGILGLLLRPWREMRVLGDRIVLKSEWRFDDRQTVIPINRIWKIYVKSNDEIPRCFLVWRDERDRCRLLRFNRDDLVDFQSDIERLGGLVTVDTENPADAVLVRREVREKLGCGLSS